MIGLQNKQIYVSEESDCSYLPGRQRRDIFTDTDELDSVDLEYAQEIGFRRSGDIIYRPACDGCVACEPTRVRVESFKPSKSQRRNVKKNSEIEYEWKDFEMTSEQHDLYQRYQKEQHDGGMMGSLVEVHKMFENKSFEVKNLEFYLMGKLIGVSIIDVLPNALSSVYFYFSPEMKVRGLGVYSALVEINECQKMNKEFWYIGYTIDGCKSMNYKSNYKPQERLGEDGWKPLDLKG